VIASFLCNMIVDGIAYTFGVFLDEFVNYYGEGKGKVAWVGSLLSGMYLTAGEKQLSSNLFDLSLSLPPPFQDLSCLVFAPSLDAVLCALLGAFWRVLRLF
jgi:hypothetical protein